MAEHEVTLTPEEHSFLRGLLETVLKDTLIEEHRTRTPTFRQYILHQEDLITGLLNKLQQSAG